MKKKKKKQKVISDRSLISLMFLLLIVMMVKMKKCFEEINFCLLVCLCLFFNPFKNQQIRWRTLPWHRAVAFQEPPWCCLGKKVCRNWQVAGKAV